jgi:hypothetical protein
MLVSALSNATLAQLRTLPAQPSNNNNNKAGLLAALWGKAVDLAAPRRRKDEESAPHAVASLIDAREELHSVAANIVRMAQEIGVMGEGVGVEDEEPTAAAWFDEGGHTIPFLLDIAWPPEARLIERDCSCELWDKVKYTY